LPGTEMTVNARTPANINVRNSEDHLGILLPPFIR
jgi:hypothetical protein